MKQIKTIRGCGLLLLTALLVALAAGCAAPNTAGITVGSEADANGIMQEVLQVNDGKLARQLSVTDMKTGQTKNGLMKASVRLTSSLNKSIVAQSKFAWFDGDGAEIDPDGDPWRPLVLHGKETRTIKGVAPNSKAVSFKLRVRRGERTKKFM